jgi:hypothetical protein
MESGDKWLAWQVVTNGWHGEWLAWQANHNIQNKQTVVVTNGGIVSGRHGKQTITFRTSKQWW